MLTSKHDFLTTCEIAQLEGKSVRTIINWRKKYNKPNQVKRGWGTNHKERPFTGTKPPKKELPTVNDPAIWNNPKWLKEMHDKGYSMRSISKIVKRSEYTIRDKFNRWKIPHRTHYESIRPKNPCCNPKWLEDHYVIEEMSIRKCARLAKVNPYTIYNWLVNFQFEIRERVSNKMFKRG